MTDEEIYMVYRVSVSFRTYYVIGDSIKNQREYEAWDRMRTRPARVIHGNENALDRVLEFLNA